MLVDVQVGLLELVEDEPQARAIDVVGKVSHALEDGDSVALVLLRGALPHQADLLLLDAAHPLQEV